MRPIRRAAVTGLLALWLAPLPALAGNESSNTSTNCSNGRCTRVESFTRDDGYGRRGWVREDRWREGRPESRRGHRYDAPRGLYFQPWGYRPRRDRDDDDD